jgi:hypothetical protein
MEDLPMKKFVILSLVVAFALLGAQAFASPPIKPPVEGFIIDTYTKIECVGDVSESEKYNWTYFEGTGMLQNQNVTLGMAADWLLAQYAALNAIDSNTFPPIPAMTQDYIDFILAHTGNMILLQNLGFQEGAEIAYQQDFTATKGTTAFEKTFKALSNVTTADPDNLYVKKTIVYDNMGDGNADGSATHSEKVGLNVVSVGSSGASVVQEAASLLSLCPWATSTSTTTTTKGYPPTNEGIAAGSSFDVKKINFKSDTTVNSSVNPALAYNVEGEGEGTIKAGFVVDLWEGKEGDVWSTYQPHQPWMNLINGILAIHGEDPILGGHPDIVWVQEPAPMLASRTSYSEHASAVGVFKFQKKVSYESVMPGLTSTASSNPINNVP